MKILIAFLFALATVAAHAQGYLATDSNTHGSIITDTNEEVTPNTLYLFGDKNAEGEDHALRVLVCHFSQHGYSLSSRVDSCDYQNGSSVEDVVNVFLGVIERSQGRGIEKYETEQKELRDLRAMKAKLVLMQAMMEGEDDLKPVKALIDYALIGTNDSGTKEQP